MNGERFIIPLGTPVFAEGSKHACTPDDVETAAEMSHAFDEVRAKLAHAEDRSDVFRIRREVIAYLRQVAEGLGDLSSPRRRVQPSAGHEERDDHGDVHDGADGVRHGVVPAQPVDGEGDGAEAEQDHGDGPRGGCPPSASTMGRNLAHGGSVEET